MSVASYRCVLTFVPLMIAKFKAGLLFKSIVQKPLLGDDEEEDTLGRFTRLYLNRFRDNILLEKGCRLEVGIL